MHSTTVLFVCLANICRSPTAQAVFFRHVLKEGLSQSVRVASAGTSGVRASCPADKKAAKIAAKKGYDLSRHEARKITEAAAEKADYIIAVDTYNLLELQEQLPQRLHAKIHLLLNYSDRFQGQDIPDPYKRSSKAYEQALALIEEGVNGLIKHIRTEKGF